MKKSYKIIIAVILAAVIFFVAYRMGAKSAADYQQQEDTQHNITDVQDIQEDDMLVTESESEAEEEPEQETEEEPETDEYEIYYDEAYSAPEDVAAYLYEWEELPPNFITKNEAEKLGWQSSKGNLWEVAAGMSIGGDKFGNREGILPGGESYRECDVNYQGGYRGSERLVYSTDDYDIYYTEDHYESFVQVYDWEEGYVWDMDIVLE